VLCAGSLEGRTEHALDAALAHRSEQSAQIAKRFPGLVRLDATQRADATVAMDDLDVLAKWVRQVTAIRSVKVAAPRRGPRETVTT
jgi:hypothetical protein